MNPYSFLESVSSEGILEPSIPCGNRMLRKIQLFSRVFHQVTMWPRFHGIWQRADHT